MTDGDWFEQRVIDGQLRSVAYVETIQLTDVEEAPVTHPVWSSKRSLLLEIESKMRIPAYIVWHNEACDDFLVLRPTDNTSRRMKGEEYEEFIKGMGRSSEL